MTASAIEELLRHLNILHSGGVHGVHIAFVRVALTEARRYGERPCLATVLVGEDPAPSLHAHETGPVREGRHPVPAHRPARRHHDHRPGNEPSRLRGALHGDRAWR